MSVRNMLVRLRRCFASAPLLLVGPVMCLVVGLAAGSAAALLKWLIGHMSEAAHSMMGVTHGNSSSYVMAIFYPMGRKKGRCQNQKTGNL